MNAPASVLGRNARLPSPQGKDVVAADAAVRKWHDPVVIADRIGLVDGVLEGWRVVGPGSDLRVPEVAHAQLAAVGRIAGIDELLLGPDRLRPPFHFGAVGDVDREPDRTG